MYLKTLEIVGFKSFAEKTRLEFEPGMTAIVGPNGCGKSNVSDSIRWVLGEQSAKALRGTKMEDVIFNGTDTHKPLGMAEVSITLADCEGALGMEFHEVTVTRRVFRSGEGQYFINKQPCRLKDIQRLFMDTGIGTNSYSLMEQGKIDRILSSRPDDRREVFEEASGITKFKSDKKEAIRKLEQTEANLLRLADIVREVKRQIISLQRQAGKARRYQTLMEQLRGYDLFASRERLLALDQEITTLGARLASISEQDEAARQDIQQTESRVADTRSALENTDRLIADGMEAAVRARTELDRIRELVAHNRDRMHELEDLSARDSRDAEEARSRLAQHENSLTELDRQAEAAAQRRSESERSLALHVEKLNACEQQVEEVSRLIHRLRTEQVELDMRGGQLQNELATLDAEERTNIIRRERLAAEHAETQRAVEVFVARQTDMTAQVETRRGQVTQSQCHLASLLAQQADKTGAISQLKQTMSEWQARLAARQAQIDLLHMSRAEREGFPDGARRLLDPGSPMTCDRTAVLGPLAELVRAEAPYHLALEAVLRPWLDALVIRDQQALVDILRDLSGSSAGAARLLNARAAAAPTMAGPGVRLIDHVHTADEVQPLLGALVGNVFVVEREADLPIEIPAGAVYVTLSGLAVYAHGGELWNRDEQQSNPLARQQLLAEWQREQQEMEQKLAGMKDALSALLADESTVDQSIAAARAALEDARRQLALAEGELQVLSREAQQAGERTETVSWELKALQEQHHSGDDRRTSIAHDIDQIRARQGDIRTTVSEKTEELRRYEQARSACMTEVNEHRVQFSESKQQVENLASRREQLISRIEELKTLIEERSRGVSSYQARIADLRRLTGEAETRVAPLEAEVSRCDGELKQARQEREERHAELTRIEHDLRGKRQALEDIMSRRSQADIEVAEQRMRRQNLLDRVTSDYRVTVDQVLNHVEPAWENGQRPDRETLETLIAELRAKLEAMGPVNLVAIEEYQELEKRHDFLVTQQTDLTNAKQQLMDLIREINKKTTEMFQQTFDQVNKNFQEMFTKLFGGGQAKLVLVDEGDVLESGIEIIARPPGKKLQTVSLLSGGERTMTAVALLFSLYLVKPSPFCVLDELDAALDDANIGRFVRTVQGFMERSQFVVITHNRQTIAAARCLYGVTMEQHGVSKIVSVKFADYEEGEGPAAASAPAPEPAVN